MILKGKLIAETPLYRGNARKTLFTRDADGSHRLISLAGEISGTAQSLMDAFLGRSRDGRNTGLLNRLWQRLYGDPLPEKLISRVTCKLREESYPRDHFFDLRMGLKLDEDRWAAISNANYKMETVFRHSAFDLTLTVDDALLQRDENQARLYYLLRELQAGRFWFGAGKSKGLGRLRLEMDLPFPAPETPPAVNPAANHLRLALRFDALNPVLVGWNWGKVDPDAPAFAAVEGQVLVQALRDIPLPIRQRLEMSLSGPILSPEDWKKRLAQFLPRTIAIWLMEQSSGQAEVWTLTRAAASKLGRGKYGLPKKVMAKIEPLVDQPFPSRQAAQEAFDEALGKDAKQTKRILKVLTKGEQAGYVLNRDAWQEVAEGLGLDPALGDQIAAKIDDEAALVETLAPACQKVMPRLDEQIDQQITLIRSDSWVDVELATREEHLRIKTMLLEGKITERQWGDADQVPEGVSRAVWRDFVKEHRRVRYRHMVHPGNLRKSIANDQNFIAFLKGYRDRARQELSQPYNIDFRAGGPNRRIISRKYGKPYDTVFMRMLSWSLSSEEEGAWEVYIPGSTLKGAFRKRAAQVLKTVWGETRETREVLDRLFGAQGRRGLVFFSDAYLTDPYDPERAWCSMDGVKMDPKTGQPIETAKRDYLFAYGQHLTFQLRLDLQDIREGDREALALLAHLLRDFSRGDIPIGGEKTSGFGWVQATVHDLTWLTADPGGVSEMLFGERFLTKDGIWQRLDLSGEEAVAALTFDRPLVPPKAAVRAAPPRAEAGFISHRAFGGYCGMLHLEVEVLTPLHVRESGEPSRRAQLADGRVNGWDFFSLSPPAAGHRPEARQYALPSHSLRGMIRHLYTIASDSREESADISRLNPADSLFGWVGKGPNQAIAGRLSFGFAHFAEPELVWFQVPYPYGQWRYHGGQWVQEPGASATQMQIAGKWRLFPHAPLAPIVKQLDDFTPTTAQASYFRAILPGARARFTLRFWNLEEDELQRLLWCIALEEGLAHKLGKHRYLGMGSLRLRLLPESHLIDWAKRYAGEPEEQWRLPVPAWSDQSVIAYYAELRRALRAERL